MIGYAAPQLDAVRLGFIGVGARGSGHAAQMLALEGVEIKAICDLYKDWADRSAKRCVDAGRPAPTVYVNGSDEYKRLLARDDIDAVIISTPWEEHARMAIDAMKAGKHAFVEVPACVTLEEEFVSVDEYLGDEEPEAGLEPVSEAPDEEDVAAPESTSGEPDAAKRPRRKTAARKRSPAAAKKKPAAKRAAPRKKKVEDTPSEE